jgi:hypothetical protein
LSRRENMPNGSSKIAGIACLVARSLATGN